MVFSPKHNRRRGLAVNTLINKKQLAVTDFTEHIFCQCRALSVKCPGSLTEPWRLAEKPLKILMTAVMKYISGLFSRKEGRFQGGQICGTQLPRVQDFHRMSSVD